MLINLSNHPSSLWSEKQISAAIKQFGSITDISFPNIPPDEDEKYIVLLARKYGDIIEKVFEEAPKEKNAKFENAIHLMGEMTFCFALMDYTDRGNYNFYASTTNRIVSDIAQGEKTVKFDFVRFRKYASFYEELDDILNN